MVPGERDGYHRAPGMVWMALVPGGLALLTLAAFSPDWIPYGYLGPVGTFVAFLVNHHHRMLVGGAYATWILHFGEAMYAHQLCQTKNLSDDATMKWTVQTFVYGLFSLKHLLAYKPKKKAS